MKTIKKHLKVFALFFSVLILIQGCTIYKSTSVTLEEASKTNNKVRVEKRNGEKVKYSKIVVLNDGNFYGVKKEKYLFNNILIDQNDIDKIQLKDKTMSTILTVAIPVVIIGVIAYALRDGIAVDLSKSTF